jgi:hypothetical protein
LTSGYVPLQDRLVDQYHRLCHRVRSDGVAKRAVRGRERGHIRKRGNSYQVLMYAGVDPITGKETRLVESASDPNGADRILDRMRAEVAKRKRARTRVTLRYCERAGLVAGATRGYSTERGQWRGRAAGLRRRPSRRHCPRHPHGRPGLVHHAIGRPLPHLLRFAPWGNASNVELIRSS